MTDKARLDHRDERMRPHRALLGSRQSHSDPTPVVWEVVQHLHGEDKAVPPLLVPPGAAVPGITPEHLELVHMACLVDTKDGRCENQSLCPDLKCEVRPRL